MKTHNLANHTGTKEVQNSSWGPRIVSNFHSFRTGQEGKEKRPKDPNLCPCWYIGDTKSPCLTRLQVFQRVQVFLRFQNCYYSIVNLTAEISDAVYGFNMLTCDRDGWISVLQGTDERLILCFDWEDSGAKRFRFFPQLNWVCIPSFSKEVTPPQLSHHSDKYTIYASIEQSESR